MRQARTWLAGPSRRFWGHRGDVARRRGAAGALWGLFTPNRRRNLSPSIPALLLNQKRHYLLFLPRTGPAAQPALLAAVPRAQKPREIPSALVTWLGPGFHLPLAAHPKLGHNPPCPAHTRVCTDRAVSLCVSPCVVVWMGKSLRCACTCAHKCVRVSTSTCTRLCQHHTCANTRVLRTLTGRAAQGVRRDLGVHTVVRGHMEIRGCRQLGGVQTDLGGTAAPGGAAHVEYRQFGGGCWRLGRYRQLREMQPALGVQGN